MDKPANKPLACVGALVQGPNGTWLIVRTTKWRGFWGVPGGKIEYGETFVDAVKREFREEVGLDLRDVRLAQVQEAVLSPEFHKEAHFVLIDFFARADSEDITPNEEIAEWAWVTLEQASAAHLNTYTRTLVELARDRFARG